METLIGVMNSFLVPALGFSTALLPAAVSASGRVCSRETFSFNAANRVSKSRTWLKVGYNDIELLYGDRYVNSLAIRQSILPLAWHTVDPSFGAVAASGGLQIALQQHKHQGPARNSIQNAKDYRSQAKTIP